MRIAQWFIFLSLAICTQVSTQQTRTYTTHPNGDTPSIPTMQSELPNKLLGVTIESWRYDPQDKIVILHLVNNSGKDVTGFNISIAEKYADGTTNYVDGRAPGMMMQDFLLPMINFQTGLVRRGGMVIARAGTVGTAPMKDEAVGVGDCFREHGSNSHHSHT